MLIQKEVSAQFTGGDGTEGNPYQITNLTELNDWIKGQLGFGT